MAETEQAQNVEDGPWEHEDELCESGDEDQDKMQPPGSGPYATLNVEGAQVSAGSSGHPDSCMPCTFYCFTRRGCNRGLECRFCHLTHQSKLQQRREAWKKQQREKRKSIRERVAAEALARRHTPGSKGGAMEVGDNGRGAISTAGGCNAAAMVAKTMASYNLPVDGRQNDLQGAQNNDPSAVFSYNPSRSILTIGQDVEFRPQLAAHPTQFRLKAPLPPGLILDPASGVIRGAPSSPQSQTTAIIEADFLGGRTARATMDLEVVDFTRGGFVIGHLSEFSPGKFMLLLYVPEEGSSEKRGNAPPQGISTFDPGYMPVGPDADALNPQAQAHAQSEWQWSAGQGDASNRGGQQKHRPGQVRPKGNPQAGAQPDWW